MMNLKTGMPLNWSYVKLDLFDNADTKESLLGKQKLKLAISFRKDNSQDWNYYRASLNSPRRHFKRGVEVDWDREHYEIAEQFYDAVIADLGKDLIRINISKCYAKGYAETKTTVEGLSAVVWRDQQNWNTALIIKNIIYCNRLNFQNISPNSKQTGIIASVKLTGNTVPYKRIRVDDLL